MADVFTETKRSEVMSLIRSRGNRDTEFRMISMFREHRITGWRRGAPLPGRPDFIFRGEKVAVFVDGCFGTAARGTGECHRRAVSTGSRSWHETSSATALWRGHCAPLAGRSFVCGNVR
jgi:G:T-mismatch repair DNA endonuclease (very short patch repair protein)